MKILILFLLVSLQVDAQYIEYRKMPVNQFDYSGAYVPTAILFGTFLTVNQGATQTQRDRIAFTGMVTAAGTYFIIEGIKARKAKKRRYAW